MVTAGPGAKNSYPDDNWMDFLMTHISFCGVAMLLSALMIVPASNAARLQPTDLKVWKLYIESASKQIADRATPGKTFLWTDENAERLAKVRAGGIAISQITPKHARRMPAALISDWLGAVFIPNAKIAECSALSALTIAMRTFTGPMSPIPERQLRECQKIPSPQIQRR